MVALANARWALFAATWRDYIDAKSVMRVCDVYRLGGQSE